VIAEIRSAIGNLAAESRTSARELNARVSTLEVQVRDLQARVAQIIAQLG
jgi:polyhydroxyalkanoate synthesis regulator phasin